MDDQSRVAKLRPSSALASPPAARLQAEDIALASSGGSPALARIVRPHGDDGPLPVVLCLEGPCGLDCRDADDGFVHDLVAAGLAALLPYGSPIDDEAIYRVLCWVAHDGPRRGLDGERIAVAATGASGSIAAGAVVLAARRGGPAVRALIVTDHAEGIWQSNAHATAAFLRDLLGAIERGAPA